MKQESRWARIGRELGEHGQREAFISALRGSRGKVVIAAAALELRPDTLPREARRLGIDYPTLLEEAASGEKTPTAA